MLIKFPGIRNIAANGFMNSTSGEEEQRTGDIYPDGPLQSGTNSLRRVKNKTKVRFLLYTGCMVTVWNAHELLIFHTWYITGNISLAHLFSLRKVFLRSVYNGRNDRAYVTAHVISINSVVVQLLSNLQSI